MFEINRKKCTLPKDRYKYLTNQAQFIDRKMFQTKIVEKFETNILHSITFFENFAVYEIM